MNTEKKPKHYAQLQCFSNYSFLFGASHPHELIEEAERQNYFAIALTDECSLAGIAKAHVAANDLRVKFIVGSYFRLSNGCRVVVIAPDMPAYQELSGFITLARRRAAKGAYEAHFSDLRFRLQNCLIIWRPESRVQLQESWLAELCHSFRGRLWLGAAHQHIGQEDDDFALYQQWSQTVGVPIVACSDVYMHQKKRKPLLDVLTAIRLNQPIHALGAQLHKNAENYLKSPHQMSLLFPDEWLKQTRVIADMCTLDLSQLRYQYPRELVPDNLSPGAYLRSLVEKGAAARWPNGKSERISALIHKELSLIEELSYEYYFLTVYDVVRFARSRGILCQGRGSAANSVVCYCLMITEVSPEKIQVLFERFISKERDEPPDIDVDFEHERREEVIQYIYSKYGRERAALAATVVTYRSRSAIRDVGKALGFDNTLIEYLLSNLSWWDRTRELAQRIEQAGYACNEVSLKHFYVLVDSILGFPRHLSQHVGGFIITERRVSDIVPLENAAMPDRTIIQWDKEDLESMGLLKVDVLALGMLSAIRKAIDMVKGYDPSLQSIADIPSEDPETYEMLCRGDSVGVFQVESRAQMSMLPRLKPRCYYDLVIQIAIVRPGPIQGNMVHPFLRRRDGLEEIRYPSPEIEAVLQRTLGVPIFQEQAISLAMVAAGFSGGQADQLRRAMASWGKNGRLLQFQEKFIQGMLRNGYSLNFAERLFEQIKGFGGYGFPESHSASFALLCYFSSWLKCHHPEAFYTAILNSLPMGFYSASQLIQDALRHGVVVLPVDINHSQWDSIIEPLEEQKWAMRLGFRRIKGFSQERALGLVAARKSGFFTSMSECARRANLTPADLECLAAGDVFAGIESNRQQARWQAAAIEHTDQELPCEDDELLVMPFSENQEMIEDYRSLGLSLRAHPVSFLRQTKPFDRCCRHNGLLNRPNGSFIRIAGLVTGRQRPGTAKGTVFLTLEDETGNANVVVWPATQTHFRRQLLTSKLLVVEGRVEHSQGVVHVIAGKLLDFSSILHELAISSRDFH